MLKIVGKSSGIHALDKWGSGEVHRDLFEIKWDELLTEIRNDSESRSELL